MVGLKTPVAEPKIGMFGPKTAVAGQKIAKVG